MLFNSFDFGLFLVVVYLVYWAIGTQRRKAQNVLILLASYLFYGLWDWRFLGLLLLSSLIDYVAGIAISKSTKRSTQRRYLWLSILWNLGVLFTFKYFNFFVDSFQDLFGMESGQGYTFWNVAIPLGLSFYTFQTMSYSIDVFQKKIKPTRSLLNFLCFVSFFPQLVAGPIEKASQLLPQFERNRSFDLGNAKSGLRQILWGLFKKIIVAEKLGVAVTMAFDNPEAYNSITLVFAAVLFCYQVYCDFSGYTDIAIGTAKLFGFKLSRNFNLPYLAKNVSDFWKRWHITLTKWFTDYVYLPLARSGKRSNFRKSIALFLTFVLVGFWHGANWTFILFGVVNALFLLAERAPIFRNKKNLQQQLASLPSFFSLGYVFMVFTISAVLFRSHDMNQALFFLKRIGSFAMDGALTTLIGYKLGYLAFVLVAELATRNLSFPLENLELKLGKPIRWLVYYALIIIIIQYAEPKEAFIYFQF